MPRTYHRLTEHAVRSAVAPGLYPDGAGLYLQITRGGSRSWIFRYGLNGRVRHMGLGRSDLVTLSQARKASAAAAALKARGIDPIDARKAERAALKPVRPEGPSFEGYADQYIEDRASSWRNDKHPQQWRSSMATYAYPVIGKLGVADVTTAHMLEILKPIWLSKPEMASRVRGRIERILAAAAVEGLRSAANVALWKGHLSEALPPRRAATHFDAMAYDDVPAFMEELRAKATVSAAALEFLILNASRTSEVLGARWSEVSENDRTWTVPAARMKMKKAHVVPLTPAALAVLEKMRPLRDEGDFIFPGMIRAAPLSTNSLLALLQRQLGRDCSVHGFRSSFRDWAGDCTNFPREVAEAALAHAVGDRTEAAYRRSTALAKRRELMSEWSLFCAGAKIIELKDIPAA